MLLLDIVEKIPATFWGVIVGSFFTITGVVITNISNTNRLKIQLDYDRNIKKNERELSLKKEIYLAATEAIATGINLISNIPNININTDDLFKSFTDKSPSMFKINVIANDDTTRAFFSLMEELSSSIVALSYKRIKLNVIKIKSDDIQKQLDQSINESNRLLNLLNENALTENRSFIQQCYENEQQKISVSTANKAKLIIELTMGQLALAQECPTHSAALAKLLIPLLKNIRKELELPFNEIFYTEQIDKSFAKQSILINKFIGDIVNDLSHPITDELSKLKDG